MIDFRPWIPSEEDLEQMRKDIDWAMASEYRTLVHHFGLEITVGSADDIDTGA
jgi:hypothetical protein